LECLEADCHFFGHGTPVNLDKAVHFYAKAMKLGSSKAILRLARIFEEGIGVPSDWNEAKKLYEKLENEDPYAAYSLGKMYEEGNDPDGDGTPDIALAIKYYERAIKLGSQEAEVKLAQIYVKGIPGILDPNP